MNTSLHPTIARDDICILQLHMMRFEVGFNELASYNCESLACILQLCVMRFLIGVNALASYNCVSDVEYKEHRQAHPNSGSDAAAAAALL